MTESNDMQQVNVAALAAAHGMAFVLGSKMGNVYVIGNTGYNTIICSKGLFFQAFTPFAGDRAEAVLELVTRHDAIGAVPATPESLEVLTELGMEKIASGLAIRRIPPIPDGTHVDLYR